MVSCYSEKKVCCPESIPVILNVHVICIIVDITFNIDKTFVDKYLRLKKDDQISDAFEKTDL